MYGLGDDESWTKFIEDTLKDLNANSTKGFAFNVLTSYVDYKNLIYIMLTLCICLIFVKETFQKKVSHD